MNYRHRTSPFRTLLASLALALIASLTIGVSGAAAAGGQCKTTKLKVHVFLEGGEKPGQRMHTTLNDRNLIPLLNPYNPNNSGQVTTQAILDRTGSKRPVDWIYLEVVDAVTGNIYADTSGLVQANGKIVSNEGKLLKVRIPKNDDLKINVYHWSHLPAQSAVVNRSGNKLTYDFRQSNLVPPTGQHQTAVDTGYALFAGNGDQDGYQEREVNASDLGTWSVQNGTFNQYLNADYNMDGDVNGADKIITVNNNGNSALFTPGSYVGCP